MLTHSTAFRIRAWGVDQVPSPGMPDALAQAEKQSVSKWLIQTAMDKT